MRKEERAARERLKTQWKKKNEYIKTIYDRIALVAPKGTKDAISAVLKAGESRNEFINSAIREEIKRRTGAAAPDPQPPQEPERRHDQHPEEPPEDAPDFLPYPMD